MYANSRAGGRIKTAAYKGWIRGELKALLAQRARAIGRRAKVSIVLPRTMRGDCDNRIKAALDLLVRAGVLIDDRSDYVASVTASFGNCDMCHISVEPELP
jgi:Holliday junction resolvase RusA-like endonuclease